MRGSVPWWVGIAYDRRERSADGAFYAADADVRLRALEDDRRAAEVAEVALPVGGVDGTSRSP